MSRRASTLPPGALAVSIPFQFRVSPDVPRARDHHLAWVAGLGLWPNTRAKKAYCAADFPFFCGFTHPWAVREDLDLVTDLIGWSWLWDDSLDKPGYRRASPARTQETLDMYRRAMAGQSQAGPEIPLLVAWLQLLDRLTERTSAAWRERNRLHWEATFDAYVREAVNNSRGVIPTLEQYLPMRRSAGGMDICLDWVEAAAQYELPPHLHSSPELLALRQAEQDVVAMTNDLFSAHLEWNSGNTDNVVHVIAQQEQCTWQEAAYKAQGLIATALADFHEAEKQLVDAPAFTQLPQAIQGNARRFIDAMKSWMRGSLEWHLISPRYR